MPALHIIQGGIRNGDKAWLERAAGRDLKARSWVAPKSAEPGDEVVVYITGYGFFATARIDTHATPRSDWPNRYSADLRAIRLIRPPISLGAIQRRIPNLKWANYPRSITSPTPKISEQIRSLIIERRRTRTPELDDEALEGANIEELRRVALLKARPSATTTERKSIHRARSRAIRLYVLRRADGRCEGCKTLAPFQTRDGSDYLEPHHIYRLSDEGPDHPANVIGLCPNCHRRAHYSVDSKAFTARLVKRMLSIERR